MLTLYAESFAPWCEWCEKARWALDHHQVAHRYREHIPLLGEVSLHLAARRPFGRVTLPLLVDGADVLMDSVAVARFAEQRGAGAPLFQSAHEDEDEIAAWNERSEIVMTSGRAMLLPRMSRMGDALREQLPPFVPGALRGALTPIAATGVAHLMRKYAHPHRRAHGSRTARVGKGGCDVTRDRDLALAGDGAPRADSRDHDHRRCDQRERTQ